jgi:MoaA/NifB/PqqE/SkfB family radical SAM enzyme
LCFLSADARTSLNIVMNNICYHPWVGLDISPQKEFRPCCKYPKSLADNFKDYQNSIELIELKDQFLKGQKPLGCKKCWDDEDSGMPSKREIDWKYVFNETPPPLDKLKILMLAFGNSCNLACMTCSSYQSTTWIKEEEKLQKIFPNIKIHKHHRFYQDKDFLDQIKQISTEVSHVYLLGGEPFLTGTDEHLDFLDYLISNGSENIILHYVTNTTIFATEKFWEKWKKFKKIDLQLSIDGQGQHFNYNRWPAEWDQVLENIKLYQAKVSTNPNLKLTVGHVISIFTVFYFPEFFKWCLQNNLKDPYISLLSDPKRYDIRSLPIIVKDKIKEKLDRFKFNEIVEYMYQDDFSDTFDETQKIINLLDKQRNHKFEETFPEFYQLLKDAGCQI